MKKLLLLGGSRYLLPAIDAAHEIAGGVHVITCDYLPDNIAHKYSDEYHNISIIDKDAVLELARSLKIDGILSFATDPGVITAAYVAEKLHLPSPAPYESVIILQNKDKFRDFLEANGFNTPKHMSFTKIEEAHRHMSYFSYPIIVKPVDSAGSKGVKKVCKIEELDNAIINALNNSISKRFIIEEFIDMEGSQSGSDSFVIDGKLVVATFDRQFYDKDSANPFTPAAMCYPCDFPTEIQSQLKNDIQRIISLLNIKTTIINVECRLGKNGKPYIIELSPRAGGNRVPEIVRYATGVDMIRANVRSALGLSIENLNFENYESSYARVVLHCEKSGIFRELVIDKFVEENYLIEKDLWVKQGDIVNEFTGANQSIGLLFVKFPDIEIANKYLSNIKKWIKIIVQ